MNEVRLTGTLTKDPYKGAKGYVTATLACPKRGTEFKEWIRLYAPAGEVANAFDGAKKDDAFEVFGEWDSSKNKEGAREAQVKVFGVKRVRANQHGVHATDADIPNFDEDSDSIPF